MDWTDPQRVQMFRERAPDIHLLALLPSLTHNRTITALDLGCAAGRNTAALLSHGARTFALDNSPAMLAAAAEAILSMQPSVAPGAVLVRGSMTALPYRAASFDLIVALGIYHQARSDSELIQSVGETRRALRADGVLLVSIFSTEMLPSGSERVPGERFFYATPTGGRVCRLSEHELTALFAAAGLALRRPVEIRRAAMETGERVTHVGLFGPAPIHG